MKTIILFPGSLHCVFDEGENERTFNLNRSVYGILPPEKWRMQKIHHSQPHFSLDKI
jgi:hypothetical protein